MKNPRSILITGASSGIGAGLALEYARPGIRLALTARNETRLADIAAKCRVQGAEVALAALDVTDQEAMAAWIAEVDRAKPLDLVIANAGISGGHDRDGKDESPEDVKRIMRVNFDGTCHTINPVIPAMRQRGRGQVALISSLAALRGLPYSPAYCASKAALVAYGEGLRAWLRPDGIEVSIVLPGFVATPMSARVMGPQPLKITVDQAVRRIRHGLEHGRARIAFPILLDLGTRLMAALPAALIDPILNRIPVSIRPGE